MRGETFEQLAAMLNTRSSDELVPSLVFSEDVFNCSDFDGVEHQRHTAPQAYCTMNVGRVVVKALGECDRLDD